MYGLRNLKNLQDVTQGLAGRAFQTGGVSKIHTTLTTNGFWKFLETKAQGTPQAAEERAKKSSSLDVPVSTDAKDAKLSFSQLLNMGMEYEFLAPKLWTAYNSELNGPTAAKALQRSCDKMQKIDKLACPEASKVGARRCLANGNWAKAAHLEMDSSKTTANLSAFDVARSCGGILHRHYGSICGGSEGDDPCRATRGKEIQYDPEELKRRDARVIQPWCKNIQSADSHDPCKREDPCKKKDPCQREDPCKKKDPCQREEDPCKRKEDPCKRSPRCCVRDEVPHAIAASSAASSAAVPAAAASFIAQRASQAQGDKESFEQRKKREYEEVRKCKSRGKVAEDTLKKATFHKCKFDASAASLILSPLEYLVGAASRSIEPAIVKRHLSTGEAADGEYLHEMLPLLLEAEPADENVAQGEEETLER